MKRMSWMLGAVVVGVAALNGCSSESSSASKEPLTVQGSVSSRLGTDNARAVAIAEDGKKVWSYLDRNGDFTLKLPTGKSYRVLIANQLPGGGQKVIGKVALKNGASETSWISAKAPGKVSLGTLTKLADASTTDIAPKCFCDEDEKTGTKSGGGKESDDWGDEDEDFGDEKGGYGDKGSSKGGWDDGEWGGGGWDDEDEDFGDKKAGDKGDDFDKESNHDDDNDCYGDDEDYEDWGGKKGKDGADGKPGKEELSDEDLCDVCTDGGFVKLEPSKKDSGKWGDVDKKDDGGLPEGKACKKKSASDEETTDKTADKDPSGDKTADKGEPTYEDGEEPTKPTEPKQPTASKPQVESKKEGDKCSVKSQCGANSCIAAKCMAK